MLFGVLSAASHAQMPYGVHISVDSVLKRLAQSRLSEQVSGLERQMTQLKAGVQRELNEGGYRLGPVKSRLQEMLEDFAVVPSLRPSQRLQQPVRPSLPSMAQQPPVNSPQQDLPVSAIQS